MSELIQEILQDIYKFDPSLMSKENQLVTIIETLIDLKPDTTVDDEFKNDLRSKILNKIDELNLSEKTLNKSNTKSLMYRSRYFFSGVLLSSLVFAFVIMIFQKDFTGTDYSIKGQLYSRVDDSGVVNNFADQKELTGIEIESMDMVLSKSESSSSVSTKPKRITSSSSSISSAIKTFEIAFNQEIKKSAANSFGKLNFAPSANGRGGGGDMALSAGSSGVQAEATADMKIAGSSMIYIPKIYKYVYSGTGFSLPVSKMAVYKRQTGNVDSTNIVEIIKSVDLNKIDIRQLTDMKVDNISINEDKEYGLQLNLNFKEGSISLWQNYEKWPRIDCRDEQCYKNNRVKITDIPRDDVLISIADSFVKKYGINLDGYGAGYVDNQWKNDYERYPNKDDYYIPEVVNVVYPLKIDDKEILEEYGGTKGVFVSIDIRTKKVSGVSGLEKITYIASDYDIDTNTGNILKIAEKGGRYGFGYEPENAEYVEVPIGNPVLKYVNVYNYNGTLTQQYVVPAYVFPVLKQPGIDEYFSTQIVVPLVKDFYKYDNNGILRGVEGY